MGILLNGENLSKGFSGNDLFTDLTLAIEDGEHVGIIGANGVGKSTLLRILAGLEEVDSGRIVRRKHLRLTYVAQSTTFGDIETQTIYEYAMACAQEQKIPTDLAGSTMARALTLAGFTETNIPISTLSGGWKKRLAICTACADAQELVLFDEPTNHLDWDGLIWLEKFLKNAPFAWLMISHDRYLLENIVTRIVDIEPRIRGGLFTSTSGYREHVRLKIEAFEQQQATKSSLENKLRNEEEWLRRQPKARATKSRSRIDAAGDLRGEVDFMRGLNTARKSPQIAFSSSGRKTKKLIEISDLDFSFKERQIISNLSITVTNGQCIGIVGPNGIGKSTLFQLILEKLKPTAGQITLAGDLRICHFDQMKASLPQEATLKRALWDHGDQVIFQGRATHIVTWARKFGFTHAQLDVPVRKLSGGEKARILIARLMLVEADVLLLDEPGNDLDIETLEILEDSLLQFQGAILIISHDRYMMEQICGSFLSFTNNTHLENCASLSQALKAGRKGTSENKKSKTDVTKKEYNPTKKLSYKDQREYDQMEELITDRESSLAKIHEAIVVASTASDSSSLQDLYNKMEIAQAEVDSLYQRWSILEAKLT